MAFPKRSAAACGPAQKPVARPVAGNNSRPAGNSTVPKPPAPKPSAPKHTAKVDRVKGEFY